MRLLITGAFYAPKWQFRTLRLFSSTLLLKQSMQLHTDFIAYTDLPSVRAGTDLVLLYCSEMPV